VDIVQQYLHSRLVDEMHVAISPVLLGSGERLFEGINLPELEYTCTESVATEHAMHVVMKRSAGRG
jgi:dihydrofolate reductase